MLMDSPAAGSIKCTILIETGFWVHHQKSILFCEAIPPSSSIIFFDRTQSSNQMQLDLFTDQANDTEQQHPHQRLKSTGCGGSGAASGGNGGGGSGGGGVQEKEQLTPAPEMSSEASAPTTSFCCDSVATDSQTSNQSNSEQRRRHAINITSNPGYQVSKRFTRQAPTESFYLLRTKFVSNLIEAMKKIYYI